MPVLDYKNYIGHVKFIHKQSDERDYFYGLCINVEDREISDALYNPHSGNIYGEPAWRIPDHWNSEPISEAKLLKAGIGVSKPMLDYKTYR